MTKYHKTTAKKV